MGFPMHSFRSLAPPWLLSLTCFRTNNHWRTLIRLGGSVNIGTGDLVVDDCVGIGVGVGVGVGVSHGGSCQNSCPGSKKGVKRGMSGMRYVSTNRTFSRISTRCHRWHVRNDRYHWGHPLFQQTNMFSNVSNGRILHFCRLFSTRNTFECNPLRSPTIDDVKYFQSILSRPEKSVITTLTSNNANNDDVGEAMEELQTYNTDWTKTYQGTSPLLLRPRNTNEISKILRYCNEERIGVVPQGGNTGLCGGATPANTEKVADAVDEIILSLENLRTIHHLDPYSGILTADAGCILQTLQEYAADPPHDGTNSNESPKFLFPLDIGSKGTCQIGGNLATNAGGQYFSRFGSLHSNVVGLEVVLADGSVLRSNISHGDGFDTGADTTNDLEADSTNDTNGTEGETGDCGNKNYNAVEYNPKSHRKDNTGYHLPHLFLGSEGTLGIITKVAVLCPPLPSSKTAALLVCATYNDVLKVLSVAREELGEILSAFEIMDWNTLSVVGEFGFGLRFGMDGTDADSGGGEELSGPALLLQEMLTTNASSGNAQTSMESRNANNANAKPYYLLVESQGSNAIHDDAKMDSFLTRLYEGDNDNNDNQSDRSDQSIIQNGYLSQTPKQLSDFWTIRESCNPSVMKVGSVYKFDVSVGIDEYMSLKWEVEEKLRQKLDRVECVVCVWGHILDGNAHINIITPNQFIKDAQLAKQIERIVYDEVLRRGGSISAEHGVGQSKKKYLGEIKGGKELEIMRRIKGLFDPRGILNPGKVLPDERE